MLLTASNPMRPGILSCQFVCSDCHWSKGYGNAALRSSVKREDLRHQSLLQCVKISGSKATLLLISDVFKG